VRAVLVASTPSNIRVTIEEIKEREIAIQVRIDGKAATGYSVGEASINPQRVKVSGPRSAVELVSEIRATALVDGLRDNFEGILPLVALDSRGDAIPNVEISPSEAQVTMPITQENGFRDVAIVARTAGQPDPGYYVISIRVIPDLITVRGDPPIIDAMLPYAETEPIDLSGLTDNLVREVSLNLPSGVTPVDANPIQVFIAIEALQGSRSLNIPVQAVGLGPGLSADFSPTTVVVIVAGPLPILNQLIATQDILVTVDVTNLKPGIYQLQPKVQATHSDVSIESVFPTVISITIIQSGLP
jgi:YbbR domain-containing protein